MANTRVMGRVIPRSDCTFLGSWRSFHNTFAEHANAHVKWHLFHNLGVHLRLHDDVYHHADGRITFVDRLYDDNEFFFDNELVEIKNERFRPMGGDSLLFRATPRDAQLRYMKRHDGVVLFLLKGVGTAQFHRYHLYGIRAREITSAVVSVVMNS